jgi:hypothetical protein
MDYVNTEYVNTETNICKFLVFMDYVNSEMEEKVKNILIVYNCKLGMLQAWVCCGHR